MGKRNFFLILFLEGLIFIIIFQQHYHYQSDEFSHWWIDGRPPGASNTKLYTQKGKTSVISIDPAGSLSLLLCDSPTQVLFSLSFVYIHHCCMRQRILSLLPLPASAGTHARVKFA